ncbi:MAG: hypothetical protein ABSF12_19360 [Bryobacteraceae bacterium]|jgi:hypothetical protein
MIRSVSLFLAIAGAAHAQPADPLTALRQAAEKASSQWEALAKGLEPKIARLLPCDPNSRAAVEAVSHASDARLSALSAYMKAKAAQAARDTEAAKQVLAAQAALGGGWNAERVEADQQRTAIEAQVADLKESMRKRASLSGAEQVLIEIAALVKERSAKAEEQAGRKDLINTLLGDLVVGYQDREKALADESARLEAEAAKWSAYYTARLSRAVTECAIINPGAAKKRNQ